MTGDNPLAAAGLEFVEFASPDPAALGALFERLGFVAAARHRSKNVTLYRQGAINFIVNAHAESFAQSYARMHGTSVCAIALRVRDAAQAFDYALGKGAWEVEHPVGVMELNIPGIVGVGDSLVYFVDRYEKPSIYDIDFVPAEGAAESSGVGLDAVDHLAFAVEPGRAKEWAEFCMALLGFRIEREGPGRRSIGLVSACGRVRFVLEEEPEVAANAVADGDAALHESVRDVALATRDIVATLAALRSRGVEFLAPPRGAEDGSAAVAQQDPALAKRLAALRGTAFATRDGAALLLRAFTRPTVGRFVVEICQRLSGRS